MTSWAYETAEDTFAQVLLRLAAEHETVLTGGEKHDRIREWAHGLDPGWSRRAPPSKPTWLWTPVATLARMWVPKGCEKWGRGALYSRG
jgi:hypothetical protein